MASGFHADGQGSPDSISADLQAVLAKVRFPANRDHILDTAQDSGATNELLTALGGLPEQDYANADAVMRVLA